MGHFAGEQDFLARGWNHFSSTEPAIAASKANGLFLYGKQKRYHA